MNRDVFCGGFEFIQTDANGILTTFAAGNDGSNFFQTFAADQRFNFGDSIFARDNDDVTDASGSLKSAQGVCDNRPAPNRSKQLIETHATTVTGGNENGGKH